MRTKNLIGIVTAGLLLTSMFTSAQKTEDRPIGNFTKVSMGISGDVYISQGAVTKLTVEAEEEILGLIVTEVRNDELKIRFSQSRVRTKVPIRIWVTTPELEGLYLSGSGNMITETPIKSDEMGLKLSGSGNINVKDISCDEMDAAISGSGNIDVGGKADEMTIAISGSGNCNADEFQTEETEVRISGSGNCKVNASKDLTVAVSGSGSVFYVGKPTIDASISGSGKIKKL
jgi:Putative auto-transporter adhesin, head GIN domain